MSDQKNDEYDIRDAIAKKIKSWKRTRINRINASERLKAYSQKWSVVTFVFNVEAVIFTIISLRFPLQNGSDAVFTGIFSIYVILLQYFLATLNYEARALKFHYEQLQIEDLRLRLKRLLATKDYGDEKMEDDYEGIVREYQENLTGYENHSSIDNRRTLLQDVSENVRDWTMEHIFIYINFFISVASVVAFITLYTVLRK